MLAVARQTPVDSFQMLAVARQTPVDSFQMLAVAGQPPVDSFQALANPVQARTVVSAQGTQLAQHVMERRLGCFTHRSRI